MALSFRTMKPPALPFWLRVFTVLIVALFVGITAQIERSRYDAAILRADEHNETVVRSLAQHAESSFDMADLALVSMSRLLGGELRTKSELDALSYDMAEIVYRFPRIRGLAYYDEGGERRATSQPNAALVGINESRSAFFRHHRETDDGKLFIGKPFRDADNDAWLIMASRRVDEPGRRFGGVLTATIESSYFSYFYSAFRMGDDTHALLFDSDGTMLARYPYNASQVGKNFPDKSYLGKSKASDVSGTERVISPVTGSERRVAFRKVENLPLTVVFSVPFSHVIAPWRRDLLIHLPIGFVLYGLIAFGGWRLAAKARTHQASEASLFRLARTDALTGLLNRRSFDESIRSAWARCRASGKPLSVLMIDVDCFKAFNDAHGHPAGDLCLQVIATAIQQSVHFPGDQVVRYGGEEIAVILADTPFDKACMVAERIRAAILDLDIPHLNSTAGNRLTVSIGSSTTGRATPDAGPEALLADADRALYQAKAEGRNRVVARLLQPDGDEAVPARRPGRRPLAAA